MQRNCCMASSIVGSTIFEWRTIRNREQPAIHQASIYVCLAGPPPKRWNGSILHILYKTTILAPIIRTLWRHWLTEAINEEKIYSVHRTIFAKDRVSVIGIWDVRRFQWIYQHFHCTDENKDWFRQLDVLVRYVYGRNNDTPITFVAHSMGGRMILHFLQMMPPTWKTKYIRKVITLNTPWGGSVQSIEAVSVGYSFGSMVLDADKLRIVQRSSPSVMWLMPSEHFWKPNEVFVTTNQKNYSRSNFNELFG